MEIEVSVENILPALNEKYKNRDKDSYQKTIDVFMSKIDFIKDIKTWKFYIENTYLEGYFNYKGQDIINNIENIEFKDEQKVYFIYKLLLEFKDMNIVNTITLKLENKLYLAFKQKEYIDKILEIIKNDKKPEIKKIEELDSLAEKIDFKSKINMKGTFKSVSAVLLSISKNKSFRVNQSTEECDYKIKTMQDNAVKEIVCPICQDKKILNKNNKDSIFISKRSKIEFICKHEKSEFVNKRPISFSMKDYSKYLKSDHIDEVDFIIYNYKYFFSKFLQENE